MKLKQFAKFLLLFGVLYQTLMAQEVDNLLNDIEKKTDLSEKTKLENSGIAFIYTRDDIDRMQLTNLKDILKSIYPVGYTENEYGIADPFFMGSNHPFMSSQVRIYIDNQEITTGLYGSGLTMLGNMNIDFVDHVEVYTQSPTYEFSTEATITLIKLYTKSVAKDEGGKIKLSSGSYDSSGLNGYYASYINDWSYFVFTNFDNDKRKRYVSHNTELSRDKKYNFTLATLHKDNTNILLGMLNQKNDGFISASLDATPTHSTIQTKYIHIGVDTKIDNFTYLLTFSNFDMNNDFTDDVTPLPMAPYYGMYPYKSVDTSQNSKVFTTEIKYNLNIKNNKIITGLKYRTKQSRWDRVDVNGISLIGNKPNDEKAVQNISTMYLEDQFSLEENSIITAGAEYSKITNKYSVQNDKLFMFRLGHILTTQNTIFKTIFSHSEVPLESYLVNSATYLSNPSKSYNPERYDSLLENIIYQKDANKYELVLDYTKVKDAFYPLDNGKIINYTKDLKISGINARWTHTYNDYDKFFLSIEYRKVKNLPVIGTYKFDTIIVRNINTYKKFDIFNEIKYDRDNINKKDFYDYSAGVKYHYNRDTTINLKGTNLLDKAKTTTYYRRNPLTFQQEQPLEISPIDRKVMLSIEWVF